MTNILKGTDLLLKIAFMIKGLKLSAEDSIVISLLRPYLQKVVLSDLVLIKL